MIQSVYLVNDAGETLAAIPIGDFQIDEALFGGFLSAIQMYSKRISGKDIKELTLENYRLIISKLERIFIVTIHDLKDKNAAAINSELSMLVEGTLGDIVTDETIELIKETATKVSTSAGRATDWAKKML